MFKPFMARMLMGGAVFVGMLFGQTNTVSRATELDAGVFRVGVGAVNITPRGFETFPQSKKDPNYKWHGKFFDTGVDQKYDFEEDGAFGADGKPGKANVDDDGNGVIDDCDRKKCSEYLAKGSDDIADPSKDNYNAKNNSHGTERDGKFQALYLGGFRPYYPIFLANRFATGVHDPIWSRAVAIEGANKQIVVMVSTDLPGLTWKHINPVRRRVQKAFGIPTSQIIITSTHDHAAPDGSGHFTSTMPGDNRWYTNQLKEWIFESIAKSLSQLKPARMKAITTRHFACVDRVTKGLKYESDCSFPANKPEYEQHPEKYDEWIIQRDARDPIGLNTEIAAQQFVSIENGQTIATLVNWHNHPDGLEAGNTLVSSDFIHYIRQYVEHFLGGTAIYFTGTLGCQIGHGSGVSAPLWNENYERVYQDNATDTNGNKVPVLVNGGYDQARSTGYEIGHDVVFALKTKQSFSDDANVLVRTEAVDTPVDNLLHLIATHRVWFSHVEKADRMHWYLFHCAGFYGCVRSDVSMVRMGDVGITTLPGEIDPSYFFGRKASVADYGKKGSWKFPAMPSIRSAMQQSSFFKGAKHFFMFGEAHNYLSYLLHEPDNHGQLNFSHPNHYEEFVTTSRHFGDDAGNKLMQMLGSRDRFAKRNVYPKTKANSSGLTTPAPSDLEERAQNVVQEMESSPSKEFGSPDGLTSPSGAGPDMMSQLLENMEHKH